MTRIEWAMAYIAWSLADLVLTIKGLSLGHAELNPFAVWAVDTGGTMGLVAFKVALVTLLVVFGIRYWHGRFARYLCYAGLTLLVITVVNNILVLT